MFLVSANQPISQQAIQSGSYTELMYPNSYVFDSGSPFYLGLYTGESFPQNGIYSDPLFGWARLVNNRGVIEMLDGGLAYKAGGIYAGTQNLIPVPEPGEIGLIVLGGLVLSFARRFHLFSFTGFSPRPGASFRHEIDSHSARRDADESHRGSRRRQDRKAGPL